MIEEREHILGEVSSLDGGRGKALCLLRLLYEAGALGHTLNLPHRLILCARCSMGRQLRPLQPDTCCK